MAWFLIKHRTSLHGMHLIKQGYVMAWYLIKHRIRLHGMILNLV